jgi:Purine-nucleoside phosphorylase
MEGYALYEQAAELGKRALVICSVSDSFIDKGILTPEERQEGLSNMIMVALVVAEKFNACLNQ